MHLVGLQNNGGLKSWRKPDQTYWLKYRWICLKKNDNEDNSQGWDLGEAPRALRERALESSTMGSKLLSKNYIGSCFSSQMMMGANSWVRNQVCHPLMLSFLSSQMISTMGRKQQSKKKMTYLCQHQARHCGWCSYCGKRCLLTGTCSSPVSTSACPSCLARTATKALLCKSLSPM